MPFQNRTEAGEQLTTRLQRDLHLEHSAPDTVVVAIPRGGVLVARSVACVLQLPLDVLLVRRLNVRGLGQLESGTIAAGVFQVLDADTLEWFQLSGKMEEELKRELQEIEHHNEVYHHSHPVLGLSGKTVILVDDFMDTGITMQAAVQVVRFLGARWVVVAVPYSSSGAVNRSRAWSAAVVCLDVSDTLKNVSDGHEHFTDVTDADVQQALQNPTESR